MTLYLLITVLLLLAEILYFRIADHYNIIDHPNDRSSHTRVTIRGGGIIFLVAALCVAIIHPSHWLPVSGVFVIGLISFLDDVYNLSSRIRLLFHIIAVTMMFYYLGILGSASWYVGAALYIIVIGVINMYNFMDGINGITGIYSLVILCGLQYVNLRQIPFIEADVIWLPLLACLVFLFFNFRKKAKCFAGDVGSVTIAFWIIMLILRLVYVAHNWSYILFLVVYGVDSALTIAHRLLRKENIMKAHRLHFYQILANERKVPHLAVAAGYGLVQGGIILTIIFCPNASFFRCFLATAVPLAIIYVSLKPGLMKVKA